MRFNGTLRTDETAARYKETQQSPEWQEGCALCKAEAIETFSHWKLIKNNFPYDKVMSEHDMLVPVRHVDERGITADEWREYNQLKESVAQPRYQWIMEAMRAGQSIPEHFHVHLVVAK